MAVQGSRFWRPVALYMGIIVLGATQAARADSLTVSSDLERMPIMLAQTDGAQSSQRSDARAMVQLMNQLDALNLELNRLRGSVEELNNSVLNAEKRQRDMYRDLDTRLRSIEQSSADVVSGTQGSGEALADLRRRIEALEQTTPGGAAVVPPAAVAAASGANNTDALVSRDYESAMRKYRAGEYQDAIDAFQDIVKQYPGHPLAQNAQYWTGDSYYQLRAYRSAIDAQKALITNYPNGAKTADAMLNMGSALVGLGDVAGARQTWERLIATYPGSRAAANAGERLKRLP